MDKIKELSDKYIDAKVVGSVIAGSVILGAVLYFATKSGLKPIADAAKIASGGK